MTAEQFIKYYTNHCSNELAYGGFHEWLTPEQAHRAVEIANDAFIEKAKEFIWSHTEGSDYHVNYVLKEFENFMKGE